MKRILFTISLAFSFANFAVSQNTKLKANADSAAVVFHVTDFNNIPEQGAVVRILRADKTLLVSGSADIDGNYEVLLPKGQDYTLVVDKFGKSFEMGVMPLPNEPNLTMMQDLQISLVTKYLRVYKLDNVRFETGKSDIKTESQPALKNVAKEMTANPKMIIEIAGHTDNVGEDQNNMRLSQSRANSAKTYLIELGIPAEKLIAKGYGENMPVADNNTPEGRQQNRRTEIKVIAE